MIQYGCSFLSLEYAIKEDWNFMLSLYSLYFLKMKEKIWILNLFTSEKIDD